jgi:aminopeptidase N
VILHTLRYLIGDKAFFTALRRMAYPELRFEKVKDGRQVRFATTDDFLKITEAASGMDLDWFFDVYLRQPKLPKLMIERGASETQLWWDVPEQLPFPMPLEVQIGNEKRRYDLNNGRMRLPITAAEKFAVDPEGWILKDSID